MTTTNKMQHLIATLHLAEQNMKSAKQDLDRCLADGPAHIRYLPEKVRYYDMKREAWRKALVAFDFAREPQRTGVNSELTGV